MCWVKVTYLVLQIKVGRRMKLLRNVQARVLPHYVTHNTNMLLADLNSSPSDQRIESKRIGCSVLETRM